MREVLTLVTAFVLVIGICGLPALKWLGGLVTSVIKLVLLLATVLGLGYYIWQYLI